LISWIPACAGMTNLRVLQEALQYENLPAQRLQTQELPVMIQYRAILYWRLQGERRVTLEFFDIDLHEHNGTD